MTYKKNPKQLDFVEQARQHVLDWIKTDNIKLVQVEYTIPFVTTDKSLAIWLFFDTDSRVEEYNTNGITQKVKDKYLDILIQLNYPIDYLKEVSFFVDSDENVKKNYEGNYFYRLR